MTTITLPRAVVEQALHVAESAGYPVALIKALRAALAQQDEPDHETRAELAEQQVVQLAEERDHYRNLWQKAQQAEPLNLADPAVQKRLATQWGYVPAAQAEPVEPVAWKQGNLVTFNEDPCPVLGGLFMQFWDGEEVAARVYANDLKTLRQRCAKVNTAPPQRKPLTKEEILRAFYAAENPPMSIRHGLSVVESARIVERAHGIKE